MLSQLFGLRPDGSGIKDHVWFSRHLDQGIVHFFVVMVKSLQFTFKIQVDGSYVCDYAYIPTFNPTRASTNVIGYGRVEVFYWERCAIVSVGETRLNQRAILRQINAIRAQYRTRLSWTQCQEFLRRFVTGIVDRPGECWQYFSDTTDTSRQSAQQLLPPPFHIRQAFSNLQQEESQRQVQQQNLMSQMNWIIMMNQSYGGGGGS